MVVGRLGKPGPDVIINQSAQNNRELKGPISCTNEPQPAEDVAPLFAGGGGEEVVMAIREENRCLSREQINTRNESPRMH